MIILFIRFYGYRDCFEVSFYAFNPKDIFKMAFEWNTDRIRLSKNSSVPSGHPDELYSLQGKSGYVLDNSGTFLYRGQMANSN